jgi:hypothetical protein
MLKTLPRAAFFISRLKIRYCTPSFFLKYCFNFIQSSFQLFIDNADSVAVKALLCKLSADKQQICVVRHNPCIPFLQLLDNSRREKYAYKRQR